MSRDNLLLETALSRTELALDGELERTLSACGLAGRSAAVSRDMPGSCRLSDIEAVSSSSRLRRFAGEPMPRSGVCLNHAGSLEPSDCAICDLEAVSSAGVEGSGARTGERDALFSAAIRLSGLRLLVEVGRRCCQDKVLDLVGVEGVEVSSTGDSDVGPVRRCSASLWASMIGEDESRCRLLRGVLLTEMGGEDFSGDSER